MLRAATITIRPMVIEIAIFSSHSAENRPLVHVAPLLRHVRGAERSTIASDHLC
jgi:hypothetical protein